jgi:hypothetical protein
MRRFLIASAALAALTVAPSLAFSAEVTVEPEVQTWITQQSGPSVSFQGDVTVGTTLPDTVHVVEIPKFKKYSYAILNNKKVLVEAGTRKVIAVY